MDFHKLHHFKMLLVAVILSILFIIIQLLQSRYLKKSRSRSKFENNEGALVMGIHYDYKSTRGDKAMKKEAKRKARIEQRRAKRSSTNPKESDQKIQCMILTNLSLLRI